MPYLLQGNASFEHLSTRAEEAVESLVIHNLTSIYQQPEIPIPPHILAILKRGRTFVAPPKPDAEEWIKSTAEFSRCMGLAYKHAGKDDAETDYISSLYLPNPAKPEAARDLLPQDLLDALKSLRTSVFQSLQGVSDNLTTADRAELENDKKLVQSFLQDKNLLLLAADKGMGWTLVRLEWYKAECAALFEDAAFYERVVMDPRALKAGYDAVLQDPDVSTCLTTGMVTFLRRWFETNYKPLSPVAHAMPKLHKQVRAGDSVPARPIIPSTWAISGGLSAVASHVIEQVCRGFYGVGGTICRDTGDYVRWVERLHHEPGIKAAIRRRNRGEQQSVAIITFDIKAFYTKIGVDDCIHQIRTYLLQSPDSLPEGWSAEGLVKIIEWVFRNNFFQCAGVDYRQANGIAMGTACAPAVANLYGALLERAHLHELVQDGRVYTRYLDDGSWAICYSAEEELETAQDLIRRVFRHFEISFTIVRFDLEPATPSLAQSQFLDTLTYFRGDRFCCRPFSKPNKQHLYTHYSSFHPQPVLEAILRGEILRTIRNCSEVQVYGVELDNLLVRFRARGFPMALIKQVADAVPYGPTRQMQLYGAADDEGEDSSDSPPIVFKATWSLLDTEVDIRVKLDKFVDQLSPETRARVWREDGNCKVVLARCKPRSLGGLISTINKAVLRKNGLVST